MQGKLILENEMDRELLELAAKAVGIDGTHCEFTLVPSGTVITGIGNPYTFSLSMKLWNPLTDDGDALRLAVKLHLDINAYPCTDEVAATQHNHGKYCEGIINRCFERFASDDPYAATRRAIVRAAAEIGKNL